jgi:hypothetical protein
VVVCAGKVGLRHPGVIFNRFTTSWSIIVCVALSFSLSWRRNLSSEQVLGYTLTIQQANCLFGRGGWGRKVRGRGANLKEDVSSDSLGLSQGGRWHEHLFAEERDPSVVNGIFGNDIQDASIFLR